MPPSSSPPKPAASSAADSQFDAAYRLAAIVESSDDAIISKDLTGHITSWNAGAERIFGYTATEAVGRHVTMLIPENLRSEEDVILGRIRAGERVDHFETVRQRKDGQLLNVSLTVSPIRNQAGTIVGASKIARDITAQKQAELQLARHKERYETLNTIAKNLSGELEIGRLVDMVTALATKATGAKFGAFFYNVTDDKGESYLLYTLSGAPREAFEKFGMPRNTAMFDHTFGGRGPMRCDDVRKHPKYGLSAPHFGQPKGHLPVVSYLAVPVVSRNGEVIGGLFFGHDAPGIFDEESEELAQGIAGHAAIAMDNARLHRDAEEEIARRRAAEESKELLLHEIKHRVKNMLSTIDAIASQTLRGMPVEMRTTFNARVRALARAHDLLTAQDWKEIDLGGMVELSLLPFVEPGAGRVATSGPSVAFDSSKALLIALTLHELGTNAVKYGSLSNDTGRVDLTWTLDHGAFRMAWRESGGPPVATPTTRGFGSSLIGRALSGGGGKAKLEFAPDGVICEICLPL